MILQDSTDDHRDGQPGYAFAVSLISGVIFLVTLISLWIMNFPLVASLGLSILAQCAVFVLLLAYFYFSSSRVVANERKSIGAYEEPDRAEEKLFWKSFLTAENKAFKGRIGVAGSMNTHNRQIAADLSEAGYEVHMTSDAEALFLSAEESPCDWPILILDLDLYQELPDALNDLLVFRSECPSTVVVLLSSDVGRDDLSLERSVVGDVTLRKPVSGRRLINGIEVAKENAFLWRQSGSRMLRSKSN